MAVHKLTPNYLNKDDDERQIKSVEMTDALNIRVSSDDTGQAFVVKNAYGNTAVDLDKSLPAGTNKVIGSISDEQLGYIFYFVWNSNDDHSIDRYSVGANRAFRIIKDSVLGFTEKGFVKGNIFVNNNNDVLLYFSDGLTAPKKINTDKALVNGYPQLLTGTDDEKLAVLTVAKAPPLDPPAYVVVNNPDLKENNIKDKVFQFAYKYVYADGEHSAISPYSSLTVNQNQLRRGFTTPGQDNFYNQINVFLKYSSADVDKIFLYAREGNEGTFYEIAEVTNVPTATTATINFINDEYGVALAENERNKLYDNVPQIADSQEIVNGRLMYGGYTEGYPNIDTDVELLPNYAKEGVVYDIPFTVDAAGNMYPDFSEIDTAGLPANSKVYINAHIGAEYITVGGDNYDDKIDFDDITVVYSNRDGSGTSSIELAQTETNINFLFSGIHISNVIEFSAATSKADVITAVINGITSSSYNVSLSGMASGFVNLEANTFNMAEENALFDAQAVFTASRTTGLDELSFKLSTLDLYIRELVIGSVRREILAAPVIHIDSSIYDLSFRAVTIYKAGGIFASEDEVSTRAFKSGSSHKLGVVYYDEFNRSGGVQELGNTYIESLNDRSSENDLYGAASVVMRLQHSAPSWAKRWAPVYTGRGESELKLMYGVGGAYLPFREDVSLQITPNKVIYLSLNTLSSKSSGYNSVTGADISYTYQKGDILRIISFDGDSRTTEEFKVLGLESFTDDSSNPILDKSSSRSLEYTTGEFVVLEDNKNATGFNVQSILNKNTNWFKECVIEIYNTNRTATNIYYEIGKSYEVVNGVHQDERAANSVAVTITNGAPTSVEFTTTEEVFKGDILVSGSTAITVGNVYTKGSLYIGFGTSNITAATGTYAVSNPDSVVNLDLGDVYFRRRNVFTSSKNRSYLFTGDSGYPSFSSIARYIEDYSVSDFFGSKASSIGRPIAHIQDAKTVKRRGSITYSDYDSEDSTRLNLSSFNLSLANYKDLAYEHGSIKYLVGYNEALYFLQEKRCGVIGVGRQVLQSGSGDQIVSLSTNVLGNERYYTGEYGLGSHPESVAFKDGMTYFADVNANKVLRIDSQGITIISDVGMESYFDDKFGSISKYSTHLVGGGIDDDTDQYIVHSGEITSSQVHINTDEYSYEVSLDSTGTEVSAPIQYNPTAVFGFLTDPRTFDDICDVFDEGIEAVVYLDQLSSGAPIYTSLPFQASSVLGVATNSNLDFFVMIRVNMYKPSFFFDNAYCDSDSTGSIDPSSSTLDAFTVAYGTATRKWATRYSFVPERIDSVHSTMYSFSGGKIYRHDENADRNTFYGAETSESIVEVVSNIEPSAIKTFESVSIEGNTPWSAVITTATQSVTIAESLFKEREGFYYSYIHGATSSYGSTIDSVTSTSEIFSLGEVASVNGSAVTFTNSISTSFPLGATATAYKVGATELNSLSVNPVSISGAKQVTFSGSVTAVAGDLLVVVGSSSVEGDQVRDYYAKIKMTKTSSDPIELFAINTIVADSKAHN